MDPAGRPLVARGLLPTKEGLPRDSWTAPSRRSFADPDSPATLTHRNLRCAPISSAPREMFQFLEIRMLLSQESRQAKTGASWRRAYPDTIGIALRSGRSVGAIPAPPPQSPLRFDKRWATEKVRTSSDARLVHLGVALAKTGGHALPVPFVTKCSSRREPRDAAA